MAWSNKIFRTLVPRVRAWGGYIYRSGQSTGALIPKRGELMKSRPHFDRPDYKLLENDTERLDAFLRMRQSVMDAEQQTASLRKRMVFREAGRLEGDRPYLFIKPASRDGLLFEQSEHGWIVARAEKIATQDTFLRSSQIWDEVELFRSHMGNLRISSKRFDLDKVSFGLYMQKLNESLAQEWTL